MDAALTRAEMKSLKGGTIVCNITISNSSTGESYSYQGGCSSSDPCECDQFAMRNAKRETMELHGVPGRYTANCYYL
jgi:hypothetical protein